MSDLSLIMTAAGSIVLLLFLVMKARLHAVVALILVSMVAGLAAGMNPADIAATIQKGMGGTLGFVAVVVALGAMFGKVMEVTGALDRVAHTLLGKFGVKRANWAMALTGFVCALPLFFDVAVVLLISVAFAIVRRGGGSVVKIGIALLAGIATCQAFLIPAPGPILVASQLGADFGYMILFGLIAAVPALILAGPLFGDFISKIVDVPLPADAQNSVHDDSKSLPSFGLAMGLIGLPLLLIGLKTIVGRFVEAGSTLHNWLEFIGHPFTAIMVACLAAFYLLGIRRGMSRDEVMSVCNSAIQPAGVIILVTGAGGVFKQVLVDSGVGAALGNMLADTPLAKIDDIEFVRTIAVARITMPKSMVRLSAGRESMSEATQALCFMAGANSIFTGDKLLTTGNRGDNADAALFAKLGIVPMVSEEPMRQNAHMEAAE